MNLALHRRDLEDFVGWIHKTFAEPLASRRRDLPAGGILVGPADKSIKATPTDYTHRQDFASPDHGKEWRSFLAAAYLVKSRQVRDPDPCPAPGAGPQAPTDSLDRQLTPRSAVSFADGEGALADFFLGGVRWQIKSLFRRTGRGHGAGLKGSLFTTASGDRVPYEGDAFEYLIAVYKAASGAYIWVIPMEKLRAAGLVKWDGNTGKKWFSVHMSEEDAREHPGVCEPRKKTRGDSNLAWTEECFEGFVQFE